MRISIADIKLSPYQARDLEEDSDLVALAESIKEHGQLQPIKVRPIGEGDALQWECVFGHRRLTAMKMAGLDEIEVTFRDTTDEEAQIQALIENTQRKDLEAMELARALKGLKDATGWANKEIQRQLGWPDPSAKEYLDLLSEPADVQRLVVRGGGGHGEMTQSSVISPRHVRVTRPVVGEAEPRADLLRKAAKESLTVDQTRKLAERYRDAEAPEEKARVLEIPAKKQEALDIIREDLEKAEERAERIRPPMTATDYWGKAQAAEEQIKKLVLAARQVEVWQSGSWPMIEGCFERIVNAIEELLGEVESA